MLPEPTEAQLRREVQDLLNRSEAKSILTTNRHGKPSIVTLEHLLSAWQSLTPAERFILRHLFRLGDAPRLTAQQIGSPLGLSRHQVANAKLPILQKLRESMWEPNTWSKLNSRTRNLLLRAEVHNPTELYQRLLQVLAMRDFGRGMLREIEQFLAVQGYPPITPLIPKEYYRKFGL